MKIRSVAANSRQRAFIVVARGTTYRLPFARVDPRPGPGERVVEVAVDPELGREGFTFRLASGREGSVHMDQVLDYCKDPSYLRDLLLYQLTLEVRRRIDEAGLSRREIIRRLGTSPAQLYRLLDQTNYRKSVDQLLVLLAVLDCDVGLVVRAKIA
jgi:predicted XRE-type DNA-binding protein